MKRLKLIDLIVIPWTIIAFSFGYLAGTRNRLDYSIQPVFQAPTVPVVLCGESDSPQAGYLPGWSVPKPDKLSKFYITGGRTAINENGGITAIRNDCDTPPLVSSGTDRLDALTRSGVTVWTEEEWEERAARFRKWCATNPYAPGDPSKGWEKAH